MRRRQGDGAHHGAHGFRDGTIGIVGGIDQHHFAALPHQTHDAGGQRLGRPGGYHHFCVGIEIEIVKTLRMGGDGTAQFRAAAHRRVLVGTFHQRAGGGDADRLGAIFIREALAEIDRAMFGGERGHHREDGGRQTGEDGVVSGGRRHLRNLANPAGLFTCLCAAAMGDQIIGHLLVI